MKYEMLKMRSSEGTKQKEAFQTFLNSTHIVKKQMKTQVLLQDSDKRTQQTQISYEDGEEEIH